MITETRRRAAYSALLAPREGVALLVVPPVHQDLALDSSPSLHEVEHARILAALAGKVWEPVEGEDTMHGGLSLVGTTQDGSEAFALTLTEHFRVSPAECAQAFVAVAVRAAVV